MSLQGFFEAKSVAVVGASRNRGKTGHEILVSLIRGGFEGPIWPVNPKADEVEGLRCHPDLKSIGKVPDLVVIVVPAKAVKECIRQCAQVGVKRIIVITSGFKETGEAGAKIEQDILQLVRSRRMRMIGPNCLGMMCPSRKLNASFGGPLPRAGSIGFFSQSGSLLAVIVDMARNSSIGFSKLLSIGNKADIGELDVLKALGQDPETSVIAGYLETITDGDAFIREAERISRDKPILLVKSGETGAGAAAASSHTGRLADTQRAYECVFERAGVVRCESLTAQFDYARAFASQPLPAGPGVAVVANAGGPGIMAADAAERNGLELATLTAETQARLAEKLPATASVSNPVDILGDALADRFEHALNVILDDPNVHGAIVLLSPHAMTECTKTAEAVIRVARGKTGKPILACFLGAGRVAEAVEILRQGNVPNYKSPEFAIATIKAMAEYSRWRSRPPRVVKLFPVNRRKVTPTGSSRPREWSPRRPSRPWTSPGR